MAVVAGWPIAWCELANLELREDLRDIAGANAVRIGLALPSTDEYLRSTSSAQAKDALYVSACSLSKVDMHAHGHAEAPILY